MKFDALVRFLVAGEFLSIRVVGNRPEFVTALRNAYLQLGGTGRVVAGSCLDWTDSVAVVDKKFLPGGDDRSEVLVWVEFDALLKDAGLAGL